MKKIYITVFLSTVHNRMYKFKNKIILIGYGFTFEESINGSLDYVVSLYLLNVDINRKEPTKGKNL